MKGIADTDSAERALRLRTALWCVAGGVVMGLGGALAFGLWGFLAGWLIGGSVLYFGAMRLAERAGRFGASLYMPDGQTTPAAPDYSLGDALAAKGRLEDAAAEYERCAALRPTDPEPRFRLARLLRDRMHDPEAAARRFRSILELSPLDPAVEVLAARELAELFFHRLSQPERALPILARLADRQPATPAGQWARARMTEIRAGMRHAP